jgi:phage terminase small subunit
MRIMYTEVSRESTIPDPPEEVLGEAMRSLTPPQRRYVIAWLDGASDQSQAARMAGYGNSDGAVRVAGHRLQHNPKISAALREEADRRMRGGAILAASALIEICSDKFHKDRFKAAVELANRAGLVVETQHRVTVEQDSRTVDQIKQDVLALLQRVQPNALKQVTSVPLDVEFAEVDDPNDLSDLMP